jgi:hypothetical protein
MEHQLKEILFTILWFTNKEIPYAAERSKTKWGKYTIGSGVKLYLKQKLENLNPDYFFVMPYGFIMNLLNEKKNG